MEGSPQDLRMGGSRGSRARAAALAGTVLAVAVLAASGCGSSPKPLTRAQLTAKANAVCRTVAAKLAAATKGGVGNVKEIARIAPKLASFEQNALDQLNRLVPPPALEADWKQFTAGAQTLAESTAKLGEYAAANNLKAGKRIIESAEATQKRMAAIAKRDGLKDCEQVP